MSGEQRERGAWGEDRAALYLRLHGYRIVARNFRCRQGEIDIIARKGGIVAFVEVKLRKNAAHGEAREFVTAAKRRRIVSSAELWLMQSGCELQPRFDVIEIYAPEGTRTLRPAIRHLENAFGDYW